MDLFDLTRHVQSMGAPNAVMIAAAVLLVGALAGEAIARTTRLPRIVGYTLAGWIAVAAGQGLTMPLQGTARLVLDLALALLLFEIGCRVRLRWLLRNPYLLATSLLESLLAAVAVYAAMTALGLEPLAAAACAVLAMPASAAVAGRVALELGADGQVTQRMTVLTALNTVWAVIAMIVLKAVAMASGADVSATPLAALAVSAGESLALAAVLAVGVGVVTRRMDLRSESTVLPILGLILLAVGTARWLGASSLLVPLLAGLLLRNASQRALVWPRHFGTAGGVLVLMLFVIVGASWSPEVLAAGGLAGLVLLAVRGLTKGAVVLALSRPSDLGLRQGAALAVTLTPLSATALVMLSDLQTGLPALGLAVAPIILTAIAVLEFLGPIAVQMALRQAGELPAGPINSKEPR
jgi:Kef-type K+ transport system membrane component KefB